MSTPLHLFDAYGVELEYMIVSRETLDVLPIADEALKAAGGAYDDVDFDEVSWSNELVLHVLEMKTSGPRPSLDGLADAFQERVRYANDLLEPMGAMLLPTGMHPWMNPDREMRLWPHDYNAVYEAYNRIFDCRGHGWSNLQSTHINFPFQGDEEFGRLHAAIRLVLPILPALAASTPIMELRHAGLLDQRLECYQHNQERVPQIVGRIIPEAVFTEADYRARILEPSFRAISPYDPDRILQHEWLNSRGAIARFTRGAIEVRLLDLQECPKADVAIVRLVSAAVRLLTEEVLIGSASQRAWEAEPLAHILHHCIRSGEAAVIDDEAYNRIFTGESGGIFIAGEIWESILKRTLDHDPSWLGDSSATLETMLAEGTLSRRILRRLGGDFSREGVSHVYRELAACLAEGRLFTNGT